MQASVFQKISKHLTIYFCFCNLAASYAQDIAIGQWRDHLSYKQGIAVAEGGGMVYCATEGGFFAFNKSDNSIERLSKINGFSGTGVNALGFNKYNNVLVIAYKDANVDLLVDGKVINISDIKRKLIPGNKAINSIYFKDQYAYLSCGFGIVVLDTERQEIKDTYYIGPGGTALNIRAITCDATNIYAANDQGVYYAPLTGVNLLDFAVWNKMSGLPDGIYNTIDYYNGNIITNLSKRLATGIYNQDSIFIYNGSSWSHLAMSSPYTVRELKSYHPNLYMTTEENIFTLDTNYAVMANVYTYIFDGIETAPHPRQMVLDENGFIWIADFFYGLVKNWNTWGVEKHAPNGPNTSNVYSMAWSDGILWTTPGGVNDAWGGVFNSDGISKFDDNNWLTISGQQTIANLDSMQDIIAIAVDPKDADHIYAGSWQKGIMEFRTGTLTGIYNESNTNGSLTKHISGYLLNGGLAFDAGNNLWATNSGVTNTLAVKKTDDIWQSFDFSSFIGTAATVANILITQSGQKWLMLPRGGGILVYQDNGTFAPPTNNNTTKISTETGKGALPSIDIYSMAEDLNGEIWVGTSKGPVVFYSPESIFTSGADWDSRPVYVEQDGHTELLLDKEAITAIAIDGANRKWLGTSKSGVFLMSEDGTQQIHHFDEENSSLFSNEIKSIAIDHQTGEVFFGTTKGIISYKSTAIIGTDDFQEVYAYPNPVKESYEGLIAIKGLINNVNVKITDINGSLIYSTQAQGGQAIWDGKNFKGEKAHSGTYLVFCSNDDGSKTTVTKILIIN